MPKMTVDVKRTIQDLEYLRDKIERLRMNGATNAFNDFGADYVLSDAIYLLQHLQVNQGNPHLTP